TVIDKAGHQDVKSITHTIDKNDPSIFITEVGGTSLENNTEKHYQKDSMDVEVAVKDFLVNLDSTTVTVEKYNEETGLYEAYPIEEELEFIWWGYASLTHEFEQGTYKIKVNAIDLLGHTSYKEIIFTVDNTAPTISIDGVYH